MCQKKTRCRCVDPVLVTSDPVVQQPKPALFLTRLSGTWYLKSLTLSLGSIPSSNLFRFCRLSSLPHVVDVAHHSEQTPRLGRRRRVRRPKVGQGQKELFGLDTHSATRTRRKGQYAMRNAMRKRAKQKRQRDVYRRNLGEMNVLVRPASTAADPSSRRPTPGR